MPKHVVLGCRLQWAIGELDAEGHIIRTVPGGQDLMPAPNAGALLAAYEELQRARAEIEDGQVPEG